MVGCTYTGCDDGVLVELQAPASTAMPKAAAMNTSFMSLFEFVRIRHQHTDSKIDVLLSLAIRHGHAREITRQNSINQPSVPKTSTSM